MINGMNIFYNSKLGSGLKVVSNNKDNGLQPIQTKKREKVLVSKKCNKKQLRGNGLKIFQ